MTRIGMSGHSQGASYAAAFGAKGNVQVDMPFADFGGTVVGGSMIKSSLFVSGLSDSVVGYSSDQTAYAASPMVRRLVGLTGGDHLNVTDMCWVTNSKGETGIQVANDYGLCGGVTLGLLNVLAKCGTIDAKRGVAAVNYVTTAALEETLHCQDRSAAFDMLQTKYPEVGDFQHQP